MHNNIYIYWIWYIPYIHIKSMADISEIQLEIKAMKFALGTFADYENEEERRKFLRENFTAIKELKTYFSFSEDKLQDTLNKLQILLLLRDNLLLIQQQGMNVNVSFYAGNNSFLFLQVPSLGMAFQN